MKEILIRQGDYRDIDTITDFQISMALETEGLELDREIVEQGVKSVMKDHFKGTYYLAVTPDNIIVGCLMVTREWSEWRNGWMWWIQSVYVVPEERGNGIYKRLYNYLKGTIFSDSSVRGIRLYVDKHNIKAQRVYEALGMTCEHYITYEWMK